MKKFLHFLLVYLSIRNFTKALDFGSFQPEITLSVTGAPSGRLGYSMSNAGDIDNDGYDDIIIGAYSINQAFLVYGKEDLDPASVSILVTTLDPATTGFTITGSTASDQLGFSVSGAGDVNQDGYDDIIVGAPGAISNKGAAYVIYGGAKASMMHIALSTTSLKHLTTGFTITGSVVDDKLGSSVSGAGDLNKDGYDDVIVGAPYASSNKGAAYVIYGGAKSSLLDLDLSSSTTVLDPHANGFVITGNAAGDWLGAAVSGGGDINKDQYDDIIIGAYNKGGMQGAAYVIYGGAKSSMASIYLSSSALNPSTNGFTITGGAQTGLGGSVSNAGDINNDGYDDLVIGALYQNSFQGAVFVIYGGGTNSDIDFSTGTTLDPASTGFTISTTGNAAFSYFGYAINSAGDLNKDGYDDIIIGAYAVNSNMGAAYVVYEGEKYNLPNREFSSSSAFDPKTTAFSILENTSPSSLGMSVGLCDFNNDGFSDILIGASGGSSGGTAYILVYRKLLYFFIITFSIRTMPCKL